MGMNLFKTWMLPAGLLVSLFFCTGCPVWQNQETPVEEIQRVEPLTKSTYWLYVPSDYDRDKSYPLVVTLHGTHGFDNANDQVREWKALAEKNKFIVLAPQIVSPQGILPVGEKTRLHDMEADEQRVLKCLSEVKARYMIDDRAVMISGFSAGGYPMYFIGLRHPELFQTMIARGCNWDEDSVKTIPITDDVRKLHIFIFFGKTGVNPVTSTLDPITTESWKAFRYFREKGFKQIEIRTIPGGHERRPDVAWGYWKKILAKSGQATTAPAKKKKKSLFGTVQ